MSADRLVSDWFEVELVGTHGLIVPELHVEPFLKRGVKRVEAEASYAGKLLSFHGPLHHFKGSGEDELRKTLPETDRSARSRTFPIEVTGGPKPLRVEMPEEFSAVLETDPGGIRILRIPDPWTKAFPDLLYPEGQKQ